MSTRPPRQSAVSGHPADSIPPRPGTPEAEEAQVAVTIAAVPDPEPDEVEVDIEDDATTDDEEEAAEATHDYEYEVSNERGTHTVVASLPGKTPRKAAGGKVAAKSSKGVAPQRPELTELQTKQLKKSISDAAYAAAAAVARANQRLEELSQTVQDGARQGMPMFMIQSEIFAAATRSKVELPMEQLEQLMMPHR